MYRRIFGEKVSRARRRQSLNAQRNRREIIKAGLSRRELFKMGLLSDAGYQVAKSGLSAWAAECGPGGLNLWVANNGSNNVMLLRTSDGAVLATAPAGGGPFGLIAGASLTGTAVWTANFGSDTVSMIGL